jgi:hypothetical protein
MGERSRISPLHSAKPSRKGEAATPVGDSGRAPQRIHCEKGGVGKNVIDIVAKDVDDLLAQSDGRKVGLTAVVSPPALLSAVERFEMGLKQKVINILSDPNIAYLLLAGILAWRFSHPGDLPRCGRRDCAAVALTSFQQFRSIMRDWFDGAGRRPSVVKLSFPTSQRFGHWRSCFPGIGSCSCCAGSDLLVDRRLCSPPLAL